MLVLYFVLLGRLLCYSSSRASRLEMLGNVKNQMTNWLGGGIASLRKVSKSGETIGVTDAVLESPETDASIRGSINDADDEDDSR